MRQFSISRLQLKCVLEFKKHHRYPVKSSISEGGFSVPIWLLLQLFSSARADGLCPGHCGPFVKEVAAKTAEIKRMADILARNEAFLKKNAVSTSVSVKIGSNILIAKLQIETLQNEKAVVEKSASEKGCKTCLNPSAKGN